ncbi:CYFA0S19e01068g1_1 [Cyberlindnera fabianii]|uniref:CYFA0S19e01068g1_1 n=1 Tax=Cyberlindnera fabianii TaxID=36022 RepID=A0A061B6U3_CYBFA|nr:CYFA0S19e01068g1_1 [Cyberlindnera fabianii]
MPDQQSSQGSPQRNFISIPVERTPNSVLARRESFLNNPIGSFRGVNSLSRFASSYSRAQSFRTIEPFTHQSRSYFKDDDELFDKDTLAPSFNGQRLSTVLHRNDFRGDFDFLRPRHSRESMSNNNAIVDDAASDVIDDTSMAQSFRSPSVYSYGATQNLENFTDFQDSASLQLKKVEANGKVVTVIAGQSTAPQTVFNSVNVLIGIGLLALPLGFSHAGWLFGVPALTLCALLTFHSAKLLSRCMDTDSTLMTYSDLAYVTFGPRGRALISLLFSMDLMASGVSLIVLFADSLNALYPEISVNHFKIIAFLVLTPPSFLPLNILSVISLAGISCTIGVVILVFASGLLKQTTPGSLIELAQTNMYPNTIADALIAIGILMAPFGGHAIFPNLKVDMRHPYKFQECLKITYSITFITDMSMACIGFMMFGAGVKDEITKSVLLTKGYPTYTYWLICALMATVPLSKTPLNARPIISILDVVATTVDIDEYKGFSYTWRYVVRLLNRIIVNALFVIIAIVFPEFDKIIAFMGAGLCFLLCLILPSAFYLHICKDTITKSERYQCWITIIVSAIFSIIGTAAAIIY